MLLLQAVYDADIESRGLLLLHLSVLFIHDWASRPFCWSEISFLVNIELTS